MEGLDDLSGRPLWGVICQTAPHHGSKAIDHGDFIPGPVSQYLDAMGALFLVEEYGLPVAFFGIENLHVAKIPNWLEKIIFVKYENRTNIRHSRGFRT